MLQKHYELARRAFYFISFSPEKRATSTIAEFSEMLTEDLATVPDNYKEKYQSKFEGYFTAWLHSKSRCASSMITGPANFPVARMQKYNRWEDNKYNEFMSWRKRILAALARSERKRTQGSELDKATADLARCVKNHEFMKAANLAARKKNAPELLAAMGIDAEAIQLLLNPKYSFESKGFQGYQLSNNLANIKRLEIRVKQLQGKEAAKQAIEAGVKEIPETNVNGAIIRKDYTDDRLKIVFDGKPADNVRAALKRSGFRWSPFLQVWCRKLTMEAYRAAEYICKTELQPAA